MKSLLSLLPAAVLLSACATTQPLPAAPAIDAPEADRIAFYERHRPAQVQTESLVARRPWSPKATLTLEHGDVVRSPADLLPAMAPGSVSATAAVRSARLDDEALAWGLAATTTTVVGAVGLTGALALSIVVLATDGAGVGGVSGTDLGIAGVALGTGAVVAALAGVSTQMVAEHLAEEAAIERETAFFTYDRALRRRLNLDLTADLTVEPSVDTPLAASPATTGAP